MQAGLNPMRGCAQAFASTDFRPDLAACKVPTRRMAGHRCQDGAPPCGRARGGPGHHRRDAGRMRGRAARLVRRAQSAVGPGLADLPAQTAHGRCKGWQPEAAGVVTPCSTSRLAWPARPSARSTSGAGLSSGSTAAAPWPSTARLGGERGTRRPTVFRQSRCPCARSQQLSKVVLAHRPGAPHRLQLLQSPWGCNVTPPSHSDCVPIGI